MPGYVTLVSSIYEHMCKLHVDRPRPLLMWCLSNSVGFRAADMPGGAHRMKEVTCQTQHANMPEKPPPLRHSTENSNASRTRRRRQQRSIAETKTLNPG